MKRDCGCQLQAGRLFLCSLHAGADDAAVSDRNYYWPEAPVCVELNDLQAENARLREQAEALAAALEHACSGQLSKVEWARVVDEADAALRAFREATQ